MRKVVLIGVVLALLGASEAGAAPPLTGHDARRALVKWSADYGFERTTVIWCGRRSRSSLRCIAEQTGDWDGEPGGLQAEAVRSLYRVERTPDTVEVKWLDFAWDWS